ncbi:MAG: YafY family protein [Aggregatilineales bacterium]
MRIKRLLSMIFLLQSHGQLTAGELATQLHVSERTISRDMESLSFAGIPVIADRGRGGGWSLVEGYRTNLTALHSDEIQALMLAAPLQVLADLGLEDVAEHATLKLLSTLPAVRQQDAERLRERIHIDGTRWSGNKDGDGETITCLSALQDAIWQERQIIVEYGRGDGETVSRTLDPLGLVAKGQIWYLIARIDEQVRTYRVSRIHQVHLTNDHFTRPENFHLAEYWEQSTRQFVSNLPRFPATLRVHQDAIWLIESWRWATVQSITPTDEPDWKIVDVLFNVLKDATACVLGCGGQAQVIEPAELIDEVRGQIRLLQQAYAVSDD